MRSIQPFFIGIFLLTVQHTFAQGCSDAGFCTIGSLKHSSGPLKDSMRQKVSLFFTNGIGDESVYVFTPAVQYDNKLNDQWTIQARVTGNYASGNLGNAAGLGDIFLAGAFSPKTNSSWKSTFTLATKLPLNSGNLKVDNKSLPMQYQSSLGTIDGIVGYTLSNNRWKFSAAYQQPFTGTNRNGFLPDYWNNVDAAKYIPTNDFKRKADALLRVGYSFNTFRKLSVVAGLLGIYHLGKDTYINANISNKAIEISGSEGLTLNGTVVADYRLSKGLSVGLTAGAPFVVRGKRPDGLTRQFVLAPEFIFHF